MNEASYNSESEALKNAATQGEDVSKLYVHFVTGFSLLTGVKRIEKQKSSMFPE